MIKSIEYEDIIRTLCSFLDKYSELDPNNIVNADSIRGTDLSEIISASQTYSPNASNSFLIFELLENQEENNYATKGANPNNMEIIQSYDFHLKIYGNYSPKDSQRIAALFKQENNALNLREQGVYIRGISKINPINEFINNTLILRRDLIIKLECMHIFESIGEPAEYFDETTNIDLIVKNISTIN